MANKVTIIIDADGKAYIEGIDKASGATDKLDAKAGKLGKTIGTALKWGAVAATAALAGLTYELVRSIQAANAQEEATAKLEATLRSTAGAAGLTMSELQALANEMQRTTTFGNEAVESAESLMLTFTKIGRETFPDAIRLAADMSVGMGQDLKSSVIQLGKALNDPIEGVSALSRVGVQLSETQKEQIEQFMKVNDVASAQKVILGELTTQFGGQAAAQASTFGGRLTQLKNAFGDVKEEIGFVITKNTFFINAVKLGTEYLLSFAQTINDNRQYLMELVKSGIVSVVDGIGKAVEVLRFFHNGWLGIKLVGNAAAVVLADSLRIIFEGLRLVLKPLDLIFDGLVKLGAIDANPFDSMEAAIGQFQLSSRDVTKEVLRDIELTNTAYDKAGQVIARFSADLKKLNVEQARSSTPGITGGTNTGEPRVDAEAARKAAELYQQTEDKIMGVVLATSKLGASKEDIIAIQALEYSMTGATIEQIERYTAALEAKASKEAAIEAEQTKRQAEQDLVKLERESPYEATPQNFEGDNEFAKLQAGYTQKLGMLHDYNAQVIQAMIDSGATQAQIFSMYNHLEAESEKKKQELKLSYAAGAAGAMSNIMQNLYAATGSKNKAMFEAMKAFAIAETVIKTYQGAQEAYTALASIPIVGPALGVAAAAAAIAAGMARVQAIRSQQPGSSATISAGGNATPSYGGGSPDAYPPAQRVQPAEKADRPLELSVHIYGDVHSDDVDKLARKLVAPLQKAWKDGVH